MRIIDKLRKEGKILLFTSSKELEQAQIEYDMSLTPQERWQHVELLRQLAYPDYDPVTSRIPRPCKLIQRPGIKTPRKKNRQKSK